MNGAWIGAGDLLALSSGPWRQGADGAWRVVADDVVSLTAPVEDTDDDLTDAERAALAESDEWQAYAAAEAADVLARHGLA